MKWAGLSPYRCRDCQRRFYVNQFEDAKLRREQVRQKERTTRATAAMEASTSN